MHVLLVIRIHVNACIVGDSYAYKCMYCCVIQYSIVRKLINVSLSCLLRNISWFMELLYTSYINIHVTCTCTCFWNYFGSIIRNCIVHEKSQIKWSRMSQLDYTCTCTSCTCIILSYFVMECKLLITTVPCTCIHIHVHVRAIVTHALWSIDYFGILCNCSQFFYNWADYTYLMHEFWCQIT